MRASCYRRGYKNSRERRSGLSRLWGIAVLLAEKISKMGAKLIGGDADEAFENIREKKRADSASQVKQTPDSRGYQPALTETTLKPNAPQMRSGATGDASAEAPASTNSIPRKTQNVKSESKGNAEGVLSNWLLRKHKAGASARRGILIIRKIYMCPAGSPAGHSFKNESQIDPPDLQLKHHGGRDDQLLNKYYTTN